MKNKCSKEPYFQLNKMVKLKDSQQSLSKKGYHTINCPESLKIHSNTLS